MTSSAFDSSATQDAAAPAAASAAASWPGRPGPMVGVCLVRVSRCTHVKVVCRTKLNVVCRTCAALCLYPSSHMLGPIAVNIS